jgi:hypothetical protein
MPHASSPRARPGCKPPRTTARRVHSWEGRRGRRRQRAGPGAGPRRRPTAPHAMNAAAAQTAHLQTGPPPTRTTSKPTRAAGSAHSPTYGPVRGPSPRPAGLRTITQSRSPSDGGGRQGREGAARVAAGAGRAQVRARGVAPPGRARRPRPEAPGRARAARRAARARAAAPAPRTAFSLSCARLRRCPPLQGLPPAQLSSGRSPRRHRRRARGARGGPRRHTAGGLRRARSDVSQHLPRGGRRMGWDRAAVVGPARRRDVD